MKIRLLGCDDETEVDIEVDEKELAFLRMLQAAVEKTSTTICMPIIRLEGDEEGR